VEFSGALGTTTGLRDACLDLDAACLGGEKRASLSSSDESSPDLLGTPPATAAAAAATATAAAVDRFLPRRRRFTLHPFNVSISGRISTFAKPETDTS